MTPTSPAKRKLTDHPLPSGYEADGELGTSEEEEEETTTDRSWCANERFGSPIKARPSLELIKAKRLSYARTSQTNRRRRLSKNSTTSNSSTSSSSITSSSESSYSGATRVKRLRLSNASESEDDDSTIYVGRTSCRHHGQYPKRYRTQSNLLAKREIQWPDPASFMILHRATVVKGVACNLNDQEVPSTKDQTTSEDVSWHLISHIITSTQPFASGNAASANFDSSMLLKVSATNGTLADLPDSETSYPFLPEAPSTSPAVSLALANCTVSPTPCNIAEALSFSPRARLLLEAESPHHVVHHNGAYESFSQRQRKWWSLELLAAMEYPDLTAAVTDLFGKQAVTLRPVQSSSQPQNDAVTHFLLELSPTAFPMPALSSPSFLQRLPARAVG